MPLPATVRSACGGFASFPCRAHKKKSLAVGKALVCWTAGARDLLRFEQPSMGKEVFGKEQVCITVVCICYFIYDAALLLVPDF